MSIFTVDSDSKPASKELRRKIARLSALYDISSALNSIIDRDELLKFILKKTKELLNVEGASLILWDQKEKMFYFPIVEEESKDVEKRLKQLRFPADSGIAGWVFREGKPAVVNDVKQDKRFYKKVDEHTMANTKSILCVPLQGIKRNLGVIEAVNKKNGIFTEDDQQLLIAMADNIATSIEKANLYHDLQKAEAFLRRQNAELKLSCKQKYSLENIIGKSDVLIEMLKRAEQVSLTDCTVLIYGETGTGKELVAQAIHNNSPRASRSFVAINCGAIPENLLESELFGHEKGAFTTAMGRRIGRFEEANEGTLFLDEIGDMPLSLQVKLLRVLQEGVIQRLGSNQDILIDVRVIAATHQDLEKLVNEGKFRRDLYFRLKVFELEIPPLRNRREDIPLLIDHFIRLNSEKTGKDILGVENTALDILSKYNFPGNVRELQHVIERAMILAKKNMIGIESLPKEILSQRSPFTLSNNCDGIFYIPRDNDELKSVKAKARKNAEEKIERLFISNLLSQTQGNVSEAARQAKMNRSWLAQLISKYKMDLTEFRNNAD
ncbi:MAG: sigma 54-interacting transcriptional regulator [bacterium]